MSHYAEPACIWRDRRDNGATTHTISPGDRVTLCTAQRTWTVAVGLGDDTVTITATGIPPMRVHRAHLDPVAELDGQTTIYDALEAQ